MAATTPVEPVVQSPESKAWLGKLGISLLMLVLLLEVLPRVLLATTGLILRRPVKEQILGDNDASWRLFWEALHKRHAEWTGQFAIYDAIRGWALKPNVRNLAPFQKGKVLNSNSKGIRGTTEYDDVRPPGTHRILVLGDSFSFGTEVSDDETYSHYLETELADTQVLNLGVQGYGHDQMLLYLEQAGLRYHPDVVLLGFVYPDIYRNLWTFFAFAKPKFTLIPNGLKLTNVPVPTPEQILAREPYHSKALDVATIVQDRFLWVAGVNERRAQVLSRAILDEVIAKVRGIGAVPVFLYMPVYHEVQDSSTAMNAHEAFLQDYCQSRGIGCVFVRQHFRSAAAHGVKLEARFHWTPEMHRMAADDLANYLKQHGIVAAAQAERLTASGGPATRH